MTNLKNVPIAASQIKTHAGKLKFSTLIETFRTLPSDHLADLFHYLQNRESNARKVFSNRVKSFLPTETFRFINDKEIIWDVPFPPVADPEFTFIDLFAGIGGMRIAFQKLNGQCVFSSEWDNQAKTTYSTNFGEVPYGDITKINEDEIPKHNVLVAGFPCQAFSIAGHKSGFEDTRGTLFFDVARIIKSRKPDAFLLENVKGLVGHDKGKTLEVILRTLREDLGYFVPEPRVMNARDFGVPQHRERIFIV